MPNGNKLGICGKVQGVEGLHSSPCISVKVFFDSNILGKQTCYDRRHKQHWVKQAER